jgi:hypothetical protein
MLEMIQAAALAVMLLAVLATMVAALLAGWNDDSKG